MNALGSVRRPLGFHSGFFFLQCESTALLALVAADVMMCETSPAIGVCLLIFLFFRRCFYIYLSEVLVVDAGLFFSRYGMVGVFTARSF